MMYDEFATILPERLFCWREWGNNNDKASDKRRQNPAVPASTLKCENDVSLPFCQKKQMTTSC